MKRFFDAFVELVFWIAVFASPFLLSVAIGAIIYFTHEKLLWLSIVIFLMGIIAGVFFAERIRKKYGCARYIARIIGTSDVPDEINDNNKIG
jgi:hypothetical protein